MRNIDLAQLLCAAPGRDDAIFADGTWHGTAQLRTRAMSFTDVLDRVQADSALIGLALPSGPELIAAVTAALAAGIPFLLLDPGLSRARTLDLARRAGLDLLVTPDGVEAFTRAPAAASADPTGRWAYAVATSGSTGEPKICVVGRDSLSLHTGRAADLFGLTAEDTVLQATVPGFDVWLEEVLPALAVGARLVTLPRGPRMGAAQFTELLTETGVTVVNLPVGYWKLWSDWLRAAGLRALPPTLRLVVVGSEAVPAATAAWWADTFGEQIRLISAYGLSESTVTNFVFEVGASALTADDTVVPLGEPLPGCRYELRPRTDAGGSELVLVGDDVQLGYLSTADGARRLQPAGGRHATGDLVVVDGGRLRFLGRSDDLVKVRGVRVSLSEVAAAVRSHPGVADAAVVTRSDAGGTRLAAFVVPAAAGTVPDNQLAVGNTAQLPAGLREHLADRLAPGAVPGSILSVKALPYLPNGKLDRGRLDALDVAEDNRDSDDGIPRIMGEVLGCRIGLDDDFFEKGGHSLLAVELLNRLEAQLGIRVALSGLFAARTPRALAHAADSAGALTGSDVPLTIRPLPERIPLTAQQEGVWYRTVLDPQTRAYHCQSSITFNGPLDADRLESAFRGLVERHGIYRTSFHSHKGVPYQKVHDGVEFHLRRVEAVGAGAQEIEQILAALIDEPFDITEPPLIRAALLRVTADRHVLLIVEHHLVHDGYAFALLLRELQARYDGTALPAAPEHEYGHYALWQQEYLRGADAQAHADFWRPRLTDVPDVALLSPEAPSATGRTAVRRIQVPQTAVDQARQAAARGPATLFGLFRAALGLTLGAQSDQERFCVGMAVANRRLSGSEAILGMFVNVVPSLVEIDRNALAGDYVRTSAAGTIAGLEHQELPVSDLVRRLRIPRRGANPLYQVLLGFDDGPVPDIRLGRAGGELLERTNGHAKIPLTLTVIPPAEQRAGSGSTGAEHIHVIWEYDTGVLSETAFDDLVVGFHYALEALSTAGEARVADIWAALRAISALNPAMPPETVGSR